MNRYRCFALLSLAVLLVGSWPAVPAVQAQPPAGVGQAAAGQADVPADWWSAVQDDIRRSEYEISWQADPPLPGLAGAYQAPNRAHNLRTYFTSSGIVIVPRALNSEAPPWRLGLRLTAWSCQGATQPLPDPVLHADSNRFEYHYPQSKIVEWYVNDERGLEQGFTLAQGPTTGEIALEMEVSGDLLARMAGDGRAIEFTTREDTPVLTYGDLHAFDATGRPLPTRLEPAPHPTRGDSRGVRVIVDTGGAVYPVTVDPLLALHGWQTQGDQQDAQYGLSVAGAGDINADGHDDVLVGAPYYDEFGLADRGALFIYYGSAGGLESDYGFLSLGNEANAHFGAVVAAAGDVNGDGHDDVVASAPGGDYVLLYYGADPDPSGTWTALGTAGTNFGSAVGSAGDVDGDNLDDLIVGAMDADPLAVNSGAVYVWLGDHAGLGDGGTPSNADWSATSAMPGAQFGRSAGTAGDLNRDGYGDIVVGAHRYRNPDNNEGALFVWYGSASGLGAAGLPSNADWSAQGNQVTALLGIAAVGAGDVNGDGYDDLLAGASGYDGDEPDGGRAYAFYGAAGGLSCGSGCPVDANTAADWTQDGTQGDSQIGSSVAGAGDVDGDGYGDVVIGSPYDPSGQAEAGRAYVFRGSATGLAARAAWSGGGLQAKENYAHSVAGAGDVDGDGCDDLLVGAPLYDGSLEDEGRAYLYYGSPLALLTRAAWSDVGGQKGAHLGSAVDTAGDLNGDGFSDVVVGVPSWDNPSVGGKVLVYYGGAAGLPAVAGWTAISDQALGQFGGAVGTAGDFNGDGYADLAVGAPQYDHGGLSNNGALFVYLGAAGGLGAAGSPSNADWAVYGDQDGAQLGRDVGTAGNVNRDRFDDLIAGAPFYNAEWGRAYVYHGGATPDTTPDWTVDGAVAGGNYGYAVDTAGDVNRDGYADVIVGAPLAAHVYVYFGSASGLPAADSWDSFSTQGDSGHGAAVATAGDANGDGYSDFLIGAPQYDSKGVDRGRVYVCFGSATLPSCTWLFDGQQPGERLGGSVSTAGDVNGDGYADILAGSPLADHGSADTGRATLYYGGADLLLESSGWVVRGQPGARLGAVLGTAGDVNGDGYADVIAGAPNHTTDEMQEGWAGVYYGGPSGPGLTPGWAPQTNQANSFFGFALGTAGDLNGDGYADVVVGAPFFDNGQTNEGRVFVYHGDPAGLDTTADWMAESNQFGDVLGTQFGAAVGTAGDVNGDGYADLIVGAWRYESDETDEGAVFVWHGSALGLGPDGAPVNADWAAYGNQVEAFLGISAGTAGDVNGDGYADLIVGAHGHDGPAGANSGQVRVYHGSATGLGLAPAWTVIGDQAGAFLANAAGTAGDVNGDGYSDVLVGASNYTDSASHEGRVYVYHGSAAGLETSPAATIDGAVSDAYLGSAVGTAGDVNGDGYADVILGAPVLSMDQLYEGRVYVYFGSATGVAGGGAPQWVAGNQLGAALGHAVGTAGDVNGDGYADVVVGAPGYDAGQPDEGRVYLYLGSASGLGYQPAWVVDGDQDEASLGLAVGTAGDVNGDGYADVIAGSGGYSTSDMDKQRAYVWYGNGAVRPGRFGCAATPRQLQPDGAPLAPLGFSHSATAVRLSLTRSLPLGRSYVKLQWQVAPLGVPFDAASGVVSGISPAWVETHMTGGPAAPFVQDVTGLSPTTPYHWRVRVLYEPGNRLGQAAGPWRHVPWNAWSETDFCTPVGRIYLPMVVRHR